MSASNAVLRTQRLTARPFERSDWPLISGLLQNPSTARWLTRDGRPIDDEAKARQSAENFAESWLSAGQGPYLWRFGPRDVGYAGLRPSRLASAPGWEALWAVDEPYQGRGYATEMAGGALEAAALGPNDPVWAWTLPQNLASIRIMEKLGFRASHEAEWAGVRHVVYLMLNDGQTS